MKIFDCHFHIETGLAQYDIDAVAKNVIFNSFQSYKDHSGQLSATDKTTLIFDYAHHFEDVADLLSRKKINALKIHSRIQKISEPDYPYLMEKLEQLQPQVPVIIDAFYFGDDIDYQPSLKYIIYIAKKFPQIPVIVAHCGGINVLQYFYHLKGLKNIFFDLSFSLVYLKDTSCFMDFKNLIKFGDDSRIMFGTDYPFVGAKKQLENFLEMASDLKLTDEKIRKILFDNAANVFAA